MVIHSEKTCFEPKIAKKADFGRNGSEIAEKCRFWTKTVKKTKKKQSYTPQKKFPAERWRRAHGSRFFFCHPQDPPGQVWPGLARGWGPEAHRPGAGSWAGAESSGRPTAAQPQKVNRAKNHLDFCRAHKWPLRLPEYLKKSFLAAWSRLEHFLKFRFLGHPGVI